MDWKSLITALQAAGVTQADIGQEVGLSQPAVSDIRRGRTKDVPWTVGQKLIALHARLCESEAEASNERRRGERRVADRRSPQS